MLTYCVVKRLSQKEHLNKGEGKINHAEEAASSSPPVSYGLIHCRTSLATLSGDSFLLWWLKVPVEDPLQEVQILHLHHLMDHKETEVSLEAENTEWCELDSQLAYEDDLFVWLLVQRTQ